MSHHFTADFAVIPPGKEPVSKKLQRNNEQTASAKRREVEKLEFDNKQMEYRLNQIKEAMIKEKEQRGKHGFIWKSGKTGQLESYARNILGRTVSAKNSDGQSLVKTKKSSPGAKSAPKSGPRVKILKDEPLDLPKRSSKGSDLIQKLKSRSPQMDVKQGGSDGDSMAAINREDWISIAADRNSSDVMELQSDTNGNLSLASIQAIDPTAIGVYFVKWGRKRLLMAVDNVIRRPKTGWGNEVYFPYAGRFLAEMALKPEPPLRNLSKSPTPPKPTHRRGVASIESPKQSGGALLQGSFNEEENAVLFKQALDDWRQNKREKINSPKSDAVTPNNPQTGKTKVTEMSVHVAQCTPPPFQVKFSETSTLSYMEHVLLDKHRESDVPSLPTSFIDKLNDCLNDSVSYHVDQEERIFTVEEEDERDQIRRLFSPLPKDEYEVTIHGQSAIIEEVMDDDSTDGTDHYIVVETPPPSPTPSTNYKSNVTIEEVVYGRQDDTADAESQKRMNIQDSASQNGRISTTPSTEKSGKQEAKNGTIPRSNRESVTSIELKNNPELSHSGSNASDSPNKQVAQRWSGTRSAKAVRSNFQNFTAKSKMLRSKSSHSGEVAGSNHKETNITHSPSAIVKEISRIPINPDALYTKGLSTFFSTNSMEGDGQFESHVDRHSPQMNSLANDSSLWNPVSSVFSPDMGSGWQREEESQSVSSMSDNSEETDDARLDKAHASAAMLLGARPDAQDTRDSNEEDEKALDDLERELASRTGNITADGRISRLIDEWSVDSDLDIIDDPGLGSGLSSPDVDRKSLSAAVFGGMNENRMDSDFQNMEQMIMGDMSDDYDEEDEDVDM